MSYGIFGLIDAIEKFDLGRGFKFETYAIARIKGNILDELRSIDWVPRSVRAKARALEKAFSTLEGKLHRTPTDAELAEELDLSEDQLQTTLGQISFTGLVALDEMLSGGDRGESATLGDTLPDAGVGPVAAYEVEEMRHILADALGMNDDQLQQALSQISLMSLVTFDAAVSSAATDDPPLTVGDILTTGDDDPLAAVELAELRRALADAIERLSERERVVVSLYYHDGLTLAEIGEVLGVTESRACQIHGKAVTRLRLSVTPSTSPISANVRPSW